MKRFIFSLLSFLFLAINASVIANELLYEEIIPSYDSRKGVYPSRKVVLKDSLTIHTDTILVYTRGANGLIQIPPVEWTPLPVNVSFRDTIILNPAYLPVVFDGKILPEKLDFRSKDKQADGYRLHLLPEEETLAPQIRKAQQVQDLKREYYTNMNNIENIRYNAFALKKIPQFDQEEVTKRNILHDLITVDDPITVAPVELERIAPRYIYWTYSGEHNFHISQNFVSDNWYKGGANNFSLINQHKLALNYKKDKVSFSNTFEWRLKLLKSQGDNEHDYIINEDLVRLENTLGYKAFNNWEYTARLESQTQLFNSYPVNSTKINTAFLSPLVMNFGVGMKYSTEKAYESDKHKKLKFSVNVAPVSLNYIYLRNDTVAKRQGVEVDKNSKFEVGSTVNSDLSFSFNRFMSWSSRLKYFTNYEYAEVEFENKFNMALNRYLSTAISMYWRFDDRYTVAKEKNLKYFQLNEVISFGLTYRW